MSTAVACVSGPWEIWFLSCPFLLVSETNERERASKRQSSPSISRQPAKAALSTRSSPLGTSVVEHFNRKVIQRFPASSSLIILTVVFFMSECQNYTRLNNADRKITYGRNPRKCDRGIGPGWFRFEGSAGTRMPTSCTPAQRCSADATGWLKGGHPTVADGKVSRRVCFHCFNACCHWKREIFVRNCGSYYVYYLRGTPACNLRYCSTD